MSVACEKTFVIKHVFKNVMNLEENSSSTGPIETHFGVPWNIRLYNDEKKYLTFHLDCLRENKMHDWSILTEFTVILNDSKKISKKFRFSYEALTNPKNAYLLWHLKDELITGEELEVEFQVKIKDFRRVEEKKLRDFNNEESKESSDVVLLVGGEKFYVLKKFLVHHSTYFDSLFSGRFVESGKSEIQLKNISAYDFQNFLETIYGEPAVTDDTVERILDLADFFDSKTAFGRCEEFLLNRSKLPLKEKFNAAIKCQSNELKKKCMSEMKTKEDVKSVLPKNATEFHQDTDQLKMSATDDTEKKFVIKHVFKDVENLVIDRRHGAEISGPVEEHFGVKWKLRIRNHAYDSIEFYLDCLQTEYLDNWKIETKFETFASGKKIRGVSHDYTKSSCFALVWITRNIYSEYTNNSGDMAVKFHVTIKSMIGIEKKKLRNFDDDSAKEHSDVVLKIGDQMFHVNKMYLSYQSSYFKSLFSGSFSESQMSEIELKEMDAQDFQNFLELLHGDSFVGDDTVEGILNLADFFDSKTAIRRCEEFLLNRSKLPLKVKFHAAIKCQLDELKKKCISEMKTKEDVKSVIPKDHKQFDTSVWAELFEKLASF